MTKTFGIEELERIIEPTPLMDVLESLRSAGLVSSYRIDYLNSEVEINVPKHVEIAEFVAELSKPDLGNESLKPRRTRNDDDH